MPPLVLEPMVLHSFHRVQLHTINIGVVYINYVSLENEHTVRFKPFKLLRNTIMGDMGFHGDASRPMVRCLLLALLMCKLVDHNHHIVFHTETSYSDQSGGWYPNQTG